MIINNDAFTPGSSEAVDLGCTCPVLDNGHGAGCGQLNADGERMYWMSEDCPLHGDTDGVRETVASQCSICGAVYDNHPDAARCYRACKKHEEQSESEESE